MSDPGMERPEELPPRLQALAREVRQPPATPREEIWAAVQARRKGPASADPTVVPLTTRRSLRRPASWWAARITGVAALIALGIGIGRVPSRDDAAPLPLGPVAGETGGADRDDRGRLAYTMATLNHLGRVETFLTTIRSAPADLQFTNQARDLLTSTRLLLDAPDVDPRLRSLLSDLEDVLVQIVQYDARRGAEELDLITEGLDERQVLPRLRSAVPAGGARLLRTL